MYIDDVDTIFREFPGLEAEKGHDAQADYDAIYDVQDDLLCPYDDMRAKPYGYTKPRIVNDVVFGRFFKVRYRQRRYKCPGCRRESHYDSPYVRQGSKTSKRFDSYVADKALYQSFDEVANLTGNIITRAHVGKILKCWAETELFDYFNSLVPPTQLGIHIVGSASMPYLLLSDLEYNSFLDIFPVSEAANQAFELLKGFARQDGKREVCTDIDSSCFVPAKAVYTEREDVTLCVSRSSIYKSYAAALLDSARSQYSASKKKLFLQLISTPLSETILWDEREKMISLAAKGGMKSWVDSLLVIRDMIQTNKWNQEDYKKYLSWKSDIAWDSEFRDVVEDLNFAQSEIEAGFRWGGHERFEKNTNLANDIISLNQKCDFQLLRARMLLTGQPMLARVQSEKAKGWHHGIKMLYLYDTMRQKLLG